MKQKVRRHTRSSGSVRVKTYYRNIRRFRWLNIKTVVIGGIVVAIATGLFFILK